MERFVNGSDRYGDVSNCCSLASPYYDTIARQEKLTQNHVYVDEIKKVIFNDPATIVYWRDGSKTVVKCGPDDTYDPEKGLAMAICKYVYGNGNAFHKVFKKWLPKEEEGEFNINDVVNNFSNLADAFKRLFAPVPDEDI